MIVCINDVIWHCYCVCYYRDIHKEFPYQSAIFIHYDFGCISVNARLSIDLYF